MNAPALERSGSTTASIPAIGPGSTRHVPAMESSTVTPRLRSSATVMSRWGCEGSERPTWWSVKPCAKRGAARRSAETNWLDADASMLSSQAEILPRPWTVNGSVLSPSTSMPKARSDAIVVAIGRSRARGSPSKVTAASLSAASGGTKRMTVPASPQSMEMSPGALGPGVTSHASSPWAMSAPNAVSASAISLVSRATSGWRSTDGESARDANTSIRLVSDLEEGKLTRASTGRSGVGAGHGSLTGSFCSSAPALVVAVAGPWHAGHHVRPLCHDANSGRSCLTSSVRSWPTRRHLPLAGDGRAPSRTGTWRRPNRRRSSSSGQRRTMCPSDAKCSSRSGGSCPAGRRTPRSAAG